MSERVATERAEPLGNSIGYSVRFDTVLPRSHCSILFCTVGKWSLVLFILRLFNVQGNDHVMLAMVAGYTFVVIDYVILD